MTRQQIEKYLLLYNSPKQETLKEFFENENIIYREMFLDLDLQEVQDFIINKDFPVNENSLSVKNKIVAFSSFALDSKFNKEDVINTIKENITLKKDIDKVDFNFKKNVLYNIDLIDPTHIFNISGQNISSKFFNSKYCIYAYMDDDFMVYLSLFNLIEIFFQTDEFKDTINKILELVQQQDFYSNKQEYIKKALVTAMEECEKCVKPLKKIYNTHLLLENLQNAYINACTTKQMTKNGEIFFFYSTASLSKDCNIARRRTQILLNLLLLTGYLIRVNEFEVSQSLINILNRNNKFNNVTLYRINFDFNAEEANKAYLDYKTAGLRISDIKKEELRTYLPQYYSKVFGIDK